MRHYKTLLGLMLLGVLMVSPNQSWGAEKALPKCQMGWLKLACTAQSFILKAKKWDEKYGVETEPHLFMTGAEALESIATGSLDMSYQGVTPSLSGIVAGMPIKILAGGHLNGMACVVMPGSPIKNVYDLKGKKVATLGRGSLPDLQFRATCALAGINPDKDLFLLAIPSPEAVTALQMGEVDAMMNCPEWPEVAMVKLGARPIMADWNGTLWQSPKEDTQCVVVVARDDYIKKHRNECIAVLKAHIQATKLINDYPKEAAEIVAKYEGCPVAGTLKAFEYMKMTPIPSVKSIEAFRNMQYRFGMIKKVPSMSELFDFSMLREALQKMGETKWLLDLDKEQKILEGIEKEEKAKGYTIIDGEKVRLS